MQEFVDGWWHGNDYETAASELARLVAPFGAALTEAELRAAMAPYNDDDEDDLRRHQIGWAASRANAALASAHRPERIRAFAQDAASDTSGWMVLEPGEYDRALSQRGAPEELERGWDDPAGVPASPRVRPIDPARALSIANEARSKNDFVLAERAARVAHERGDVLLGALALMEALVALGRHSDARPIWTKTAERWLQGFTYRISGGQWDRLLALHARLELPRDELFTRCGGT